MKKFASIILASVALFATSAKAEYKFNLTTNYCDNFTILFPTFLLVLDTYSC